MKSSPGLRDVMRLTVEMNQLGPQDRCYGPRVTRFLQSVQGFASLGNIVLGGTQNLLACGVWSVRCGKPSSVVSGNTNWDPQTLPNDIHRTIGCCAGLLIIDEEDFSIHMVHHSVRTFLLNDYRSIKAFSLERAHQIMDSIVLTFLNYEVFSKQITSSKVPKISAGAVTSSALSLTTEILGRDQAQKTRLKTLSINGKLVRDLGPALASVIGNSRENRVLAPLEFHNYAAT
ncbi:hypothetical protein BDW69DRAFT_182531 [Aspergillus filifer]